ncbi:V-type ATP synthase subunit D [bacterium]|nr:V-type ATP synthase subunit D [bacterium]
MPEIKVRPNRMELLKLTRRLNVARRGHKLLKDKQEELMRQFLSYLNELESVLTELIKSLEDVNRAFQLASALGDPFLFDRTLVEPLSKMEINVGWKSIVNVPIPVLEVVYPGPLLYGFLGVSVELDSAYKQLLDSLDKLIRLMELQVSVINLGIALESTRRRVNALEYELIPQMESAIRFISMKLEELQLETITRLMRIKDIIRGR